MRQYPALFLSNTALAGLLHLATYDAASPQYGYSPALAFWNAQLVFHFLSTCCYFTGRFISARVRSRSYRQALAFHLGAAAIASQVGIFALIPISLFVHDKSWSEISLLSVYTSAGPISLGIAVIYTIVAARLDYLERLRESHLGDGVSIASKTEKEFGLTLRDEGKIYKIPYDQIYYLSSHGRNIVVHTGERDYAVTRLY